jgi:hypothetical protein
MVSAETDPDVNSTNWMKFLSHACAECLSRHPVPAHPERQGFQRLLHDLEMETAAHLISQSADD